MDTLWVFPPGADLSFFDTQPERVVEIAIRAVGRAKDAALAGHRRLGFPISGTEADAPEPEALPG